jgi:hypothetical protein
MKSALARAEAASAAERRQLLARLLAGAAPRVSLESEADWLEMAALAQAEGVAPLLDRALPEGAGVPPAARQALHAAYVEATYGGLIYESSRARFCAQLRERSIPVILLKGAALAFTCYDDPATRPMRDLDFLIPRERLEEAAKLLHRDGYQFVYESQANEQGDIRRSGRIFEDPATGIVIELHWTLPSLGPRPEKALAALWSGAKPGPDPGSWVLRLAHTIPVICAHSTLQHTYARLLWLYDLHRVLLETDGDEASAACHAAERWGVAPCTARALLCVRELFGTALPEELSVWARAERSKNTLQGRVAALALTPGDVDRAEPCLLSQLVTSDWSLLRLLFPPPSVLRERFRLAADEPVLTAYATLMARRLRNVAVHLRRLGQLRRALEGSLPENRAARPQA